MVRPNPQKEPLAPKPYEFVPILEVLKRTRPAGHDRYQAGLVSGHLAGYLEVLSPLHVGDGQLRLTNISKMPLVRSHTRSGGKPIIPATTLKGVVRSVVEAISRSCVRVTGMRRYELPSGAAECSDKEKLCPACRLFGAMGYQGAVRFSDAVLQGGFELGIAHMPALYAPRSRTDRYRQGEKAAGRKFYQHGRTITDGTTSVEVCPEHAKLAFRLDFDNLSRAEVGLLLTGLGQGQQPPLAFKFGGGKPACYGSARLVVETFQTWEGPQALYSDYDNIHSAPADPASYLKAAATLIEPTSLKRLADILDTKELGKRECPRGNY
jgi:hypothetical protein